MLEKPLVEFGIVIGLCPGIVLHIGVDGELHVAATCFQRVDHLLGLFKGDDRVFCAVKGPHGDVFQGADLLGVAATADGGDGREPFRMRDGEVIKVEGRKKAAG